MVVLVRKKQTYPLPEVEACSLNNSKGLLSENVKANGKNLYLLFQQQERPSSRKLSS